MFYTVSPLLIHESNEYSMRRALVKRLLSKAQKRHRKLSTYGISTDTEHEIDDEGFRTIIVQLRALGLIEKSARPRSVHDKATYWTLTPFGDNIMNRLRAITRASTDNST